MPSATDRLEFAPPHAEGSLRALALAILVHVLLIAALTWGVNWKRSDEAAAFEAELWTSTPQQAAPRLAEVSPPTPVPPPAPVPRPAPPPPPPVKAAAIKPAPVVPDVDIALEQEKKRKLQQLKQAEAEKAERAEKLREKRAAELQAKKEKELEKKKEKEQQAREDLAERKALEEAKKAEAKKQDAKNQEKQKQAAAEKQKLAAASDKARQDNIKRMMGQAGATGAADAKGSAQRSSGPRGSSTTYGAIVRSAIKPNVVFTDDIDGNPSATIEVRLTLDGTVISQRLIESSGNKAWDDAAIKAIIRTAVMPKDIDGRIPDTTLILKMKPKN